MDRKHWKTTMIDSPSRNKESDVRLRVPWYWTICRSNRIAWVKVDEEVLRDRDRSQS